MDESPPSPPPIRRQRATPATAVVWLARLLLRLFFRQIEVAGAERVPATGPVVFVANHNNSLIDPALLLGFLPRRPRFLAKSTLWSHPIVRPFLSWAAALPVYRPHEGFDPAQNRDTFARCHDELAAGGVIALFPEGTSHSEPSLLTHLKTGVSRIVLEAEEQHGGCAPDAAAGGAGLGVRIVPVGLTFEDKERFRSRALVRIGDPLDPAPERARYCADPQGAVRALTGRIREALAAVTLSFPSWEEARLIERAAQVFELPHTELPAERPLGERFAVRKLFIEGYEALRQRHPHEVARVAAAVREYDEHLALFRLRDEQVAAEYPPIGVARFAVKSLWLLLVRLPLALVGTLWSLVPYQAARLAAARGAEEPDLRATYKVIASLLFYPLAWLLAAGVAAWQWGALTGAATLVLGPVSAYVALRFHERRGHFRRQVRAFFLLRSGRRSIAELRRQRAEVLKMVWELAELYSTADGDEGKEAAGEALPGSLAKAQSLG